MANSRREETVCKCRRTKITRGEINPVYSNEIIFKNQHFILIRSEICITQWSWILSHPILRMFYFYSYSNWHWSWQSGHCPAQRPSVWSGGQDRVHHRGLLSCGSKTPGWCCVSEPSLGWSGVSGSWSVWSGDHDWIKIISF